MRARTLMALGAWLSTGCHAEEAARSAPAPARPPPQPAASSKADAGTPPPASDECTLEFSERVAAGAPDPNDCVGRLRDRPPREPSDGGAPSKEVLGTFKPGELANAAGYSLLVADVKECQVPYYFKAKKGNIKLGIELVFEATSSREVPVNPYYATVTDAEGYTYTSTFGGCDPELRSVRLAKGGKARGWITFELPVTAKALKLTYDPFPQETSRPARFELGR